MYGLPVITNLIDSNLSIDEKVSYIKARCLISQLNFSREFWQEGSASELSKKATITIETLNQKIMDNFKTIKLDIECDNPYFYFLKIKVD